MTEEKKSSDFCLTFPTFVTPCEEKALLAFFDKYFTAIHESQKYSDEQIVERKRVIKEALQRGFRYRSEHLTRWTNCMEELIAKIRKATTSLSSDGQ